MAFKLKSGNKVSFKNMGSSPAKQGYSTELPEGDAGAASAVQSTKDRLLLEQQYANERAKARREAVSNMPTEEERRQENIQEERKSRGEDILDETGKKIGRTLGEELVEGEHYKTKEQLKQDKKTRRYERKQDKKEATKKVKAARKEYGRGSQEVKAEKEGRKETRKQVKAQKRVDKTKALEDRAQRERGTGESKGKVNWKKYALSGGDAAASVEHDAKYKSTEKKIAKRKAKDEKKATKKEGQKERGGSAFSKAKKKVGGWFKKK
jgi:hypothetical protein